MSFLTCVQELLYSNVCLIFSLLDLDLLEMYNKPTYQREFYSVQNNNRKTPALFLGPADNPHVLKYKMVLEQLPMSFKKQTWSDAEKDKLARGIKQQYQETLILDSLNNGR